MLIDEMKEMLDAQEKRITENIEKSAAERETKLRESILQEVESKDIGKIDSAPEVSKEIKKDVGRLFRAIVERDYVGAKALAEGTDSYGGYLVPEEFYNYVLMLTEQYGVARQYGTVINMSRDTMNIPKVSAKPSVSWYGEAEAISEGQPTFGQVQLVAKKAGLIVPVTTELFEDSAVDLNNILGRIFAEKLAYAIDYQAFRGDGTVFTGIYEDSSINTVSMGSGDTAFTNVAKNDLLNLVASVPASVAQNGKFFMHRTIWALVQAMTDGSGNYIFNPETKSIFGYPVVVTDVMPSSSDTAVSTGFIGFGDLSYLYVGNRRQMSIALADQATVGSTNLYEKDMLALRVTERVAVAVAMSNAFGLLKTAAS